MFLATTADQRFWKKDGELLFLGEWCKIYQHRSAWSERKTETLPYHWDDTSARHQADAEIQALYEELLPQFSNALSEIHNVHHTSRYWRILLGPWLFYFLGIAYDRYLSIRNAGNSGKATLTYILDKKPEEWIPNDFLAFLHGFSTDEYNLLLYSWWIKRLGEIPYEPREEDLLNYCTDRPPQTSSSSWRKLAKEAADLYCKKIPSRLSQIVFIGTYIDPLDQVKLQLSLGQAPCPIAPLIQIPHFPREISLRQKLKSLLAPSSDLTFNSLVKELIAEQIPAIYLEGCRTLEKLALTSYPAKPRVIFTAGSILNNDPFKIWAATQVEKGARLVGTQHGGHYGTARSWAVERHELACYDRYFTWGWKRKQAPQARPAPSGKLAHAVDTFRADPQGKVLWAWNSFVRYFYCFQSMPLGPQALNYVEEQFRFAHAISKAARSRVLIRRYPVDYGWNEMKRWQDQKLDIPVYQGPKSLEAQLNDSCLYVGTTNTTTYLETFAANYPTLLFWNPKYWEIHEEAKSTFALLQEADILHSTPESAADTLNEIHDSVEKWWSSPIRQEARKRFCQDYAWTRPSWLKDWKSALNELKS
jgi:putative transferase (TIGR04331 family)